MSIPALPDFCWPVDTGGCPDFEYHNVEVRDLAEALAAQTIRMLTGYSVGGCPVLLRPCLSRCLTTAGYYQSHAMNPYIDAYGSWHNACSCSPTGCSCSALHRAYLGSPVGAVLEVKINGVPLDDSAWSVQGGYLIRQDGDSWPVCQDLTLPDTETNTFSVSVQRGRPVDGLGARVAGTLACEYAKAISGDKSCRLPKNVTTITRQGVTLELDNSLFPGGLTGIREVDVYVRAHNPYGLRRPSAVWSPDVIKPVIRR